MPGANTPLHLCLVKLIEELGGSPPVHGGDQTSTWCKDGKHLKEVLHDMCDFVRVEARVILHYLYPLRLGSHDEVKVLAKVHAACTLGSPS